MEGFDSLGYLVAIQQKLPMMPDRAVFLLAHSWRANVFAQVPVHL